MRRRPLPSPRCARAGLSLIESMIALTLLGLVVTNITMVMRATSSSYDTGAAASALQVQTSQTIDRIALALAAASRDALIPAPQSPLFSSEVAYETSLGQEDGELVWDDPERIELDLVDGKVVWRQNPDSSDERAIVWGKHVSDLFEGELPNGVDDNANGLIDETGLSFTTEGNSVLIRLTLERVDGDGPPLRSTLETRVTCRN